MQVAPAGGSEGVEEHPQPEQELPQASLSCGDGGSGPRAAAEVDEITPPEADTGSVEPALTLVSVARKGGEEPERAEGGALEHVNARHFGARRSALGARTSTLHVSALGARTLTLHASALDAWCTYPQHSTLRCSALGASTLTLEALTLDASVLDARGLAQPIDRRRFGCALFPRGRGKQLEVTPPPQGRLTPCLPRRRLQRLRQSHCRYPGVPPSLQLVRDLQTIDVHGNILVAHLYSRVVPPLAGNALAGHGLAPCHPTIGDAPVPLVGTGVTGRSRAWQSSRQKSPSLWT
ncbi:UNVERIFIED_CONTAM: hypothetical protein FKN15_008197 [Acipenser sinensis]